MTLNLFFFSLCLNWRCVFFNFSNLILVEHLKVLKYFDIGALCANFYNTISKIFLDVLSQITKDMTKVINPTFVTIILPVIPCLYNHPSSNLKVIL